MGRGAIGRDHSRYGARTEPEEVGRVLMQFSPEQDELRRGLRRFLEDKSPSAQVRALMDTEVGFDPAVWAQLAAQLGLQGLAIPEEYGGAGYGQIELTVVMEEMGRALLCAPYFASVILAANALMLSTDDAAKGDYLPGIADGTTIATFALAEGDGAWTTSALATSAVASGKGWRLDGHKAFVLDGTVATLLLVVADTSGGPSLFAISADADGLTRRPVQTLDMTRKLAEVDLAATPARLIGAAGEAATLVPQLLDIAVVNLAAEQVGGTQRCLDMSVEYAKLRYQFGRPIGSFQAVKHKCADMLLDVENARSAAYYASWAAADGSAELPTVAKLAKALCSESYFRVAADTIQIHGGIGFTWEHDAHLYYRRALSSELLFGDAACYWEALAQRLLG